MSDWDVSSDEDDKPDNQNTTTATTNATQNNPKSKPNDNWDVSSDDEPNNQNTTTTTNNNPKPKPKPNDDWNASDSSDDNTAQSNTQPKPKPKPKPKAKAKPTTDAWDVSDASDNDANNNNTNNTTTTTDPADPTAEDLRKLKKLQNYKKKKRKKKKKKRKKNQQIRSPNLPNKKKNDLSIPKNQDEIMEMSSSDDDFLVDNSKKNYKNNKNKMVSYDERMRTDNDKLFGKAKAKPKDDRVMLSGDVKLKDFPLGSSRDCENLAKQLTGLFAQKLYEESINNNDVFLFLKHLLTSNELMDQLDMVDTKELSNKLNSLLAKKQRDWHKKKNPSGKKQKKPQWIVADKFKGGAIKKGGHIQGGYDAADYDLFD